MSGPPAPSPPPGAVDAVLEAWTPGYERWRTEGPDRDAVLVERWPGRPDRAAAAAANAEWLAGRVEVARGRQRDGEALWCSAPPGAPIGSPWQGLDANETATALGRALRQLHGVPPSGCPVRCSLDDIVALAAQRVASGAVSTDDLRRPYARYGPDGLLALATTSLQRAGGDEAPVVVHGACSADHLYVGGGRTTAWLRLDAVAVADRHLDLARLAKELADRAGPESVAALFDAYGLAPNLALLDALALLDELLP